MKRRIYYPSKGEKVPQVACLFHSNTEAITKKTVKETNGEMVVQYGLCWQCEGKLKLDRDGKFKIEIDQRLCKTLEDYDKNKKGGIT